MSHRKYSKKSNLQNHIKNKHKNRRFICSYCNLENSTKFALKRHIQRRHKNIQEVTADECENYIMDEEVVSSEKALATKVKRLMQLVACRKRHIAYLEKKINILQPNAAAGEADPPSAIILKKTYKK